MVPEEEWRRITSSKGTAKKSKGKPSRKSALVVGGITFKSSGDLIFSGSILLRAKRRR